MRRRFWLQAGLAAVAVAATACDAADEARGVAVGSPVPAFAAPSLAGDSVALADFRGEHVLLNVWATWCVPCREEMPDLQNIQDRYGADGLRVVGVSIDQTYAAQDIQQFLDEHAIDFTILHDSQGRVTRLFRTVGVPETFLIGPDGTLLQRWFGQIDPESVRSTIDDALGET